MGLRNMGSRLITESDMLISMLKLVVQYAIFIAIVLGVLLPVLIIALEKAWKMFGLM